MKKSTEEEDDRAELLTDVLSSTLLGAESRDEKMENWSVRSTKVWKVSLSVVSGLSLNKIICFTNINMTKPRAINVNCSLCFL